LNLSIICEQYPILNAFTIARGSKTAAEVVVCQIEHQGHIGRGECVPYGRYGESIESVIAEIEAMKFLLDYSHLSPEAIHATIFTGMKAGAARNAFDCAFWDLRAKLSGKRVSEQLEIVLQPVTTAYTISLGTAQEMGQTAKSHAHFPLLKIKVGSGAVEQDIARVQAVRANAPLSRLIVDANPCCHGASGRECC